MKVLKIIAKALAYALVLLIILAVGFYILLMFFGRELDTRGVLGRELSYQLAQKKSFIYTDSPACNATLASTGETLEIEEGGTKQTVVLPIFVFVFHDESKVGSFSTDYRDYFGPGTYIKVTERVNDLEGMVIHGPRVKDDETTQVFHHTQLNIYKGTLPDGTAAAIQFNRTWTSFSEQGSYDVLRELGCFKEVTTSEQQG